MKKTMNPKVHVAYFISSHGFGHAARACAVMNALHEQSPVFHFEIFSQTPEWFFSQSLTPSFTCHGVKTDIGLVHTTALQIDLKKTLTALMRFYPLNPKLIDRVIQKIQLLDVPLILSDISPLGIAAAKSARVPVVLIENFTWDWIYHEYTAADSRFKTIIGYLKAIYDSADYRIQAQPVCDPKTGSWVIPPMARPPKSSRQQTRQQLGIGQEQQMVLMTLGGIHEPIPCLRQMMAYPEPVVFVICGLPESYPDLNFRNIICLNQSSEFHHPDLVYASDAVIGKVGYSTMAEVYHAGVPFAYIRRNHFRESGVMESYIRSQMPSKSIAPHEFYSGAWLDGLPELLAMGVAREAKQNGAAQAAAIICDILAGHCEILEIINEQGDVIGAAPRNQIHGRNQWIHRVVHVLVFDKKGRMLLQKRSLLKDVAPGKWDTSVGGHVDFGESVEEAVRREMAEELGIRLSSFQFLYEYTHKNVFESEHVSTYICQYDGDVSFNASEIDEVKFWDMREIVANLGRGIFSDNFEDEFKRYCAWVEKH